MCSVSWRFKLTSMRVHVDSGTASWNFGRLLSLPTLVWLAFAVAGCSSPVDDAVAGVPVTPKTDRERIEAPDTSLNWGHFARWRFEGGDWSVDLPEQGWWDLVNPFVEPGSAPTAATYRSGTPGGGHSDPYVYMDILRFEQSDFGEPGCSRTQRQLASTSPDEPERVEMSIAGQTVTATKLSPKPSDLSTTATYRVCFVSGGTMYQLIGGATPASAESDLFGMFSSFRLDD